MIVFPKELKDHYLECKMIMGPQYSFVTVEKGALGRKRAHIDNWTLLKMLSVLHNAFTDVLYSKRKS